MKLSFRKNKIWIGVIIVILIFIILNLFQRQVKGFFYSFSAPIQQALWGAGESSSDFLFSVFSIGKLRNRAEELELKNQDLIYQISLFNELKKENKMLRQALDLELEKDFKLEVAQIIGKDISQDFILINKGAEQSILKDMPVITEQKVLVGRVSELYNGFSKVMLISYKESFFDAKIQREEEDVSGIVKGTGNQGLILDLIKDEVFKEDIILTSALGNIFPEALLVGRIKAVKKSDVETFQQAEIEPAFNISNIDKVFIILDF